jgi:protoporphyrinogen oxidase
MSDRPAKAIVIGAGPAGLTAAYELTRQGQPVVVLESDPEYVGGLARTFRYAGYRMDIGGHRFFSKSKEIEELWTELLGSEMLERKRSSRILYRGQFYSYPLKPMEALSKLGVPEAIRCLASYAAARIRPIRPAKSFEDWVVNQFGRRLYQTFFKTYTEKVWGMSCRELSADWAAQRIGRLSLGVAIRNSVLPASGQKDRQQVVKSLIGSFRYPRLGPGLMWETCAEKVRTLGGQVLLGQTVKTCRYEPEHKTWNVTSHRPDDSQTELRAEHLISSMPIRHLVKLIEPPLPERSFQAAESLRYRDFLLVGVILRDRNRFADNWIYIHDPDVKVGRVQNYKSWSPEMVPDTTFCCYGMEYFCSEGDPLWELEDTDILALAKREIVQLGLTAMEDIVDGVVIRQRKAYPVYDSDYQQHVNTVRAAIEAECPNLQLVGRNGMHKYNNQDHSMMTGLLAARNILAGKRKFDLWAVNEDFHYHESDANT